MGKYEYRCTILSSVIFDYFPFYVDDKNQNTVDIVSDISIFKTILRKLYFSRVQFGNDMSNFSGGQKKKVLIAKSLCEKAHLYIWDEPLNFIDVISHIQVEGLI
jgi:ATPase subunit of ABC transporter with duplicated ATPase domains